MKDEKLKEGALRFNTDKPMVDEIYPQAILEIGDVSTQGAKKYSKGNWQKGANSTTNYGSLLRHALKWYNGEDIDPETGCHHMAHVMWNAMAMIYNRDFHPELDDRPFGKKDKVVTVNGLTEEDLDNMAEEELSLRKSRYFTSNGTDCI